MKKLLLILCLISSCISYAQSNLPSCNGNFSGPCFGAYTFASGNEYVGQWKDDKFHGLGTSTFAGGEKFVGQYIDGKRNGFGTYYYANGSIRQQGLWSDDWFVQAQTTPPPVTPPVIPKPPVPVSNPQDIKRQKCIRLGLAPNSADFQQCMN